MTVLTERKSSNSVTEGNANICAIDVKYSECSCTEPRQQSRERNAQVTVGGEAIQETDLLGDNAEDVDADLQHEPICLMHIPNRVFALSRTSVSVGNGEGPSVPSGRCLGPAPGACQRHRGPDTPDISERVPGYKTPNTCVYCFETQRSKNVSFK